LAPGRGSDGAGTSVYARANLQEVAALTLDRRGDVASFLIMEP